VKQEESTKPVLSAVDVWEHLGKSFRTVFIRSVVGHQVEDELESTPVRVSQQRLKISHAAEHRMDGRIIGHIIAKITHGRRVYGREPDRLYPQALQVIKAAANAVQVANAIIITVLKRTGVNLVDNA
jgi:hypothetical protein